MVTAAGAFVAVSPPGGWELVVILFIVLLLFGAKKLPDLAGSMGRSMKEFRKASREALEEEPDAPQRQGDANHAPDRDAES